MSNSATFELKTNESLIEIERCLLQRWRGHAVDVFTQSIVLHQDVQNSVFCVLEYVFGEPEEQSMIRQCVDYLLSISLNHEIFYYRCSDFIGLVDPQHPIIEIGVDDLFREEYAPSIGAFLEQKYKIQAIKKEMGDPSP